MIKSTYKFNKCKLCLCCTCSHLPDHPEHQDGHVGWCHQQGAGPHHGDDGRETQHWNQRTAVFLTRRKATKTFLNSDRHHSHRHKPRPNENKPLPPLLSRPFRDQPVICVDLTCCCSLTFSQRYRVTLCLSLFTWALAPPLCLPHQSGGGAKVQLFVSTVPADRICLLLAGSDLMNQEVESAPCAAVPQHSCSLNKVSFSKPNAVSVSCLMGRGHQGDQQDPSLGSRPGRTWSCKILGKPSQTCSFSVWIWFSRDSVSSKSSSSQQNLIQNLFLQQNSGFL